MSDAELLERPAGHVATDQVSQALHVSRTELAHALGISRESITKTARAQSPSTQARLREMLDILNRAQPWAGSLVQAFAWYRAQPLPSFGDQTAEALVKEGRAEEIRRYLDRLAVGGFA